MQEVKGIFVLLSGFLLSKTGPKLSNRSQDPIFAFHTHLPITLLSFHKVDYTHLCPHNPLLSRQQPGVPGYLHFSLPLPTFLSLLSFPHHPKSEEAETANETRNTKAGLKSYPSRGMSGKRHKRQERMMA